MPLRFLLAVQTIGLLLAAGSWWRVSNCVCKSTLEDAAFWTGLIVAQRAVIVGIEILRGRGIAYPSPVVTDCATVLGNRRRKSEQPPLLFPVERKRAENQRSGV